MQGEALLFSSTMSVLTLLCLHIFEHRKQQNAEREKKEVGRACERNRRHVQTHARSPKQFSIQRSCEPATYFMIRRTQLSPGCYVAWTRGISLVSEKGDDGDDGRVARRGLMKLKAGGVNGVKQSCQ